MLMQEREDVVNGASLSVYISFFILLRLPCSQSSTLFIVYICSSRRRRRVTAVMLSQGTLHFLHGVIHERFSEGAALIQDVGGRPSRHTQGTSTQILQNGYGKPREGAEKAPTHHTSWTTRARKDRHRAPTHLRATVKV
jgi:hypothetical protein